MSFSIAIDIAIETEAWNVVGDLDALARTAVDAAMAASGEVLTANTEVSLVLCDDAFIQTLNAKWRGQDKPTNVLSFPADFEDYAPALGDIVIAYETVAREAADEGKSLRDHLSHMIVHGFFHLLGFDHEDEVEAEEMEAAEAKALAAQGIASPYRDPLADISQTAEDRRVLS
jgi:probable rRNA maturation factor